MKKGENTKKNLKASNYFRAITMTPAIPNPINVSLANKNKYAVTIFIILANSLQFFPFLSVSYLSAIRLFCFQNNEFVF